MTNIRTALHDLLNDHSRPLADAIDTHFSPSYRQRTNGEWGDRAGFAEHITHLRSIVSAVRIEVLDEFSDGTRYADRHIIEIDKRDGTSSRHEVYLFGELDGDGRFERVEETTLMLTGTEHDRDLGHAR